MRACSLLVVGETLVLCVVAAAIGLAMSALLFPAVSARFGDLSAYVGKVPLSTRVLAQGLGAAAVLAVLSAALPAWRTMRLKIVDALVVR